MVHGGLEAIAFDVGPYGLGEFVGDHGLELDRARAKGGAGQGQATAHDVGNRHLRARAALESDRDVATVVGEACEVARKIIAADHVEHHRDALAVGKGLDCLDKFAGLIIDGVRCAERRGGGAFGVRAASDDDLEPEQDAKLDRHRPDPARPAVDEDSVAIGGEPALEQVDPHREQGFGEGGGLGHAQDFGDGQASARGRDAIFGVTPTGDKRADAGADEVARPLPRRDHGAGYFQAGNVAHARRRGIDPHPLENVGAVDPGGGDLDEHFSRAGPGRRARGQLQLLGPAGRGNFDGAHHVRDLLAHYRPLSLDRGAY